MIKVRQGDAFFGKKTADQAVALSVKQDPDKDLFVFAQLVFGQVCEIIVSAANELYYLITTFDGPSDERVWVLDINIEFEGRRGVFPRGQIYVTSGHFRYIDLPGNTSRYGRDRRDGRWYSVLDDRLV